MVMAVAVVVGAEVVGAEAASVVSGDVHLLAAVFGFAGDVCIFLGRLFLFYFWAAFFLFCFLGRCFRLG